MGKDYRAFIDKLCKSYESALYQYAARRLRDDELAKDLVQETFLLLVIRVTEIYIHENPAGWLFRVLGNLIRRELKKPYHQELPLVSEEASLLSYTDEHFFQTLPCGWRRIGTMKPLRIIWASPRMPAASGCQG